MHFIAIYDMKQLFIAKKYKSEVGAFIYSVRLFLAFIDHVQWCASKIILQVFKKMFEQFQPTFQRNSGTNDTSIESPNIEHLESGKKLGMASS